MFSVGVETTDDTENHTHLSLSQYFDLVRTGDRRFPWMTRQDRDGLDDHLEQREEDPIMLTAVRSLETTLGKHAINIRIRHEG